MEPDWKKLYFELVIEVEQTLGQALGYPWYKDHLDIFPDATDADGVCVGEHVPESLLAEAVNYIHKLELDIESLNRRRHPAL